MHSKLVSLYIVWLYAVEENIIEEILTDGLTNQPTTTDGQEGSKNHPHTDI